MRFLSIVVCVSLAIGSAEGQEFTNAEAKVAKEQYRKDLEAARKKYADSLDEAAKKAIQKDQLEEAIKIKKVVENLRAGNSPVASNEAEDRVLWKHKDGYFERLNDGYWIERDPGSVARLFTPGTRNDEYIEISRTTASKTVVIVRLYDNRCTVSFKSKISNCSIEAAGRTESDFCPIILERCD